MALVIFPSNFLLTLMDYTLHSFASALRMIRYFYLPALLIVMPGQGLSLAIGSSIIVSGCLGGCCDVTFRDLTRKTKC